MPNTDYQNRAKPANCWKCNAPNHNPQTRACLKCGAQLTRPPSNNEPPKPGRSSGILGFLANALATIFVVSLLGVGGYIFYSVYLKDKVPADELPANSWHQPTFANWYRKRPTVQEILEKNNQVTGVTADRVKTLSAKGKVSIARGGCGTKQCRDNDSSGLSDQEKIERQLKKPWQDSNSAPAAAPQESGISDDPAALKFIDFGEIEMHRKGSSKLFRKNFVTYKGLPETTENIQVFNGTEGWNEEKVYERDLITGETKTLIRRTVKDLAGKDLDDLKQSVANLGSDLSGKTFNYSHTAKINGEINFALRVDGSETSETFYFDAVTGLLTKMDSGEFNCLMFPYADYDGVKLPSTMYFRTLGKEGRLMWMKLENIEWKINQPIEDSLFEKKP